MEGESQLRRNPGKFFFEKDESKTAKRRTYETCADCLVQSECLESALFYSEPFGIWAGFNNRGLRKLKRIRKELYEDNLSERQLNLPIEDLGFPAAALQILQAETIRTVKDMLKYSDKAMMNIKGFDSHMSEHWKVELICLLLSDDSFAEPTAANDSELSEGFDA